jgi:hypothetical protein
MTNAYTKPLPEVANDLKEELKEFVATRFAMLRSEMSEKLASYKAAMPAMILGLVLLWTCWLLFTALLVTALATAFSSPWGWVFAFLIVAGAYLLLGLILAVGAWSKLKRTKLAPERTWRVLKQDEVWLQTEARTQI